MKLRIKIESKQIYGLSIALLLILIALPMFVSKASDNRKTKFRYLTNEAYGYGEKLEYNVGYKFITAGTGYFHIQSKPIYRNGREAYDIRFQVQSMPSLDWLYRVRDQYRTVLDVSGIFPWEFEQRVREGNYRRDFRAVFEQAINQVKVKEKTYNVPDYTHDIVSAFFYVRTLDLTNMPKDSVFYLQNFWDDTTYSLGVKILGKETIKVDAGTFKCIVIEPMVTEGGLFQSEGNIIVWVSDDERKIPVKVASKIPIGYVEAKLSRYSGLRGPLKAKQ
ncbi:MAG: DUF3108 domain-containing protein [Ignavibacteriae bacterium HGW-Ignavibacteriae-1]|jgi:hypothetical protein|nr:MAG: DUF3108 domain-containing protein [Ignavibacteriae bacterium HGW-Ignavibacteriae-1]